MPKTKEREAEKSSKSSSRSSAKASVKTAAKPSARSNGSATQAKPASAKASSSKLPAAKAAAPQAKSSPALQAKSSPALQAKPSNGSAKAAATSSKSSAKITVAAKTPKSDRFDKQPLAKPVANLKSPFTKDELAKWREQLLQRRNEISSDIAGLEKDAMEAEDGHTTPNHIAERGSDADLQDVSLGIAGEEKDIIWQIDRALRKIDENSPIPFGLCEYTKEAISRNRLQLIPWTPLSIEGANYMEENSMQVEDLLVDG
jgi:DnaK suppressor protein